MAQLKDFWRQHPIQSVLYGVTALYISFEAYRALKSPESEFWNHKYGIYGVGSGPFNRQRQMDRMPTPGQTSGTTSTSTTTSSSHNSGMMRDDDESGETSMPIPVRITSAMHGIPSSIKRRVNQGDYGQDSLPEEYGLSGVFERNSQMTTSDAGSIMGLDGIVPDTGGEGFY